MKKGFNKFHKAFIELVEKYGAFLAPKNEWGTLPCYSLSTRWGNLRLSVDAHYPYATYKFQGIYLSFANYKGPIPFPLAGDFNRYSHKWNIGISGGESIEDCRIEALRVLEERLKTLTSVK